MDDEPAATDMGTGARHARVHVALTQTLAELDRLRASRAWPAEVDCIWEVLDQIKEAVKLGEFLRRQPLLTWESFSPLTEIIGTVIDEWPQGREAAVLVLEPVITVVARAAWSSKSRRHSDLPGRTLLRTTSTGEARAVPCLRFLRAIWIILVRTTRGLQDRGSPLNGPVAVPLDRT